MSEEVKIVKRKANLGSITAPITDKVVGLITGASLTRENAVMLKDLKRILQMFQCAIVEHIIPPTGTYELNERTYHWKSSGGELIELGCHVTGDSAADDSAK